MILQPNQPASVLPGFVRLVARPTETSHAAAGSHGPWDFVGFDEAHNHRAKRMELLADSQRLYACINILHLLSMFF